MRIPDFITIDGVTRPLREAREAWATDPDLPGMPTWKQEVFRFLLEFTGPTDTVHLTTSGTTGRPVSLTARKEQLVASARRTLQFLGLQAGDKALLCLPARYIAGKMMIVRALTGRLDLHLTQPTTKPAVRKRYDFSAMTPQQAGTLLHAAGGRESLSRIHILLLGGGPLPPDLEKELSGLQTAIYHTYGMTETFSHIALRRITGPERSSLFNPLPGVKVSLAGDGTLVVHAPLLTKVPLKTRDLAVMDEQGRFRITGRSDNIINTGGVKVSPETIEAQLAGLIPAPFFVAAIPHPLSGEQVVLIIRRSTPSPSFMEKIRKAVRDLPDKISRPRRLILVNDLVYTGTGKLHRKKSMEIAWKEGSFYDL